MSVKKTTTKDLTDDTLCTCGHYWIEHKHFGVRAAFNETDCHHEDCECIEFVEYVMNLDIEHGIQRAGRTFLGLSAANFMNMLRETPSDPHLLPKSKSKPEQ